MPGILIILNHPIQANLTVEKSMVNYCTKIRKCKAFKIRDKIEYPAREFYIEKIINYIKLNAVAFAAIRSIFDNPPSILQLITQFIRQ